MMNLLYKIILTTMLINFAYTANASDCDTLGSYLVGDFESSAENDIDWNDEFVRSFKSRVCDYAAKHGIPQTLVIAAEIAKDLSQGDDQTRNMLDPYCENGVCTQHVSLRGIWQYGCWCNFGNQLMHGSGAPVNVFDEKCKDLQRCLRCARQDGVNDGYECNPTTKQYSSALAMSNMGLQSKCSDANPGDDCAAHVCMCELNLIDDLLELMWSFVVYDDQYLHSKGFDPEIMCETSPQINDMECCGYYPSRFPYSTYDNDCCTNTQERYQVVTHECCSSWGVVPIGTCVK